MIETIIFEHSIFCQRHIFDYFHYHLSSNEIAIHNTGLRKYPRVNLQQRIITFPELK